jgi:hypothetical protein
MASDQPRHIGLLRGRAPTGNDARELGSEPDEVELGGVEAELEGLAIDDETAVELVSKEVEMVLDVGTGFDCKDQGQGKVSTTSQRVEGSRRRG